LRVRQLRKVAKEREKAKKLVEALDVIYKNTQDKLIYDIAKQSLTEYKGIKPETTRNQTAC
jgi:hypothetical protein